MQDAARLAADYNARQTELAKKKALQEQLDAFEAEKEVRMQEAEAHAEEAMQALTCLLYTSTEMSVCSASIRSPFTSTT